MHESSTHATHAKIIGDLAPRIFYPHHPGTTYFCAFAVSLSFRHAVLASARIFSLFALAALAGTRLAERAWSKRIESEEKPGRSRPDVISVRARQLRVSIQMSATRLAISELHVFSIDRAALTVLGETTADSGHGIHVLVAELQHELNDNQLLHLRHDP